MVSAAPSSPASRTARWPAAPPAETTKSAGISSSASTGFCLLLLFLNSSAAIYHSRHDPWSVAFVATSFTDLALLFHFIRRFEAEPRGSPARKRIKAAVWTLTSILTGMFSYKVAALMPLAVAVVIWAMGAGTVLAGFVMFFLCGDEAEQANSDDELLKAAEDGAHKQPRSYSFGVPDLHQPILSS